jgi:4-amino-4-deoxy-L-arabinose transferase-like glycosyltransferase
MPKLKSPSLLILFIILFGFVLRLVWLTEFPPSLNWDEVSLGYNAYSILHTGRDEWGNFLPSIFRAYGDYKLPVYVYAAVISELFFGLSALAVRLPSILAGTGLIAVAYLISGQIFHNRRISLVTALLVAIQPWSLFLSRVALEANLAAFFVCLGICLLLARRYLWSAVFFGVSLWTYNSARIFVPVFLFLFLIVHWRRFWVSLRRLAIPVLLLGAFLVPMLIQLLMPAGLARYQWVSLLDEGAIAGLESSRNHSSWPPLVTRLIYNRPVYLVSQFARNYVSHFTPDFLFVKGGSQYQFNIPGVGLLSVFNLPFFYLGAILLIVNRPRGYRLLLLWLLLAPVPASLTRDSPHTLRSIFMFLPVMLITSFGAITSFSFIKRRNLNFALTAAYVALLLLNLEYYLTTLAPAYRQTYSWSWQYGYSQAVDFIKNNYRGYDQIIFTKKYGEPHEFILFYWPWDPAAYRSDPQLVRYFRTNWYWVDSFAKFRFVNDWEMPVVVKNLPLGRKYLIVASPENDPHLSEITRINFLDGQPAFIMEQR